MRPIAPCFIAVIALLAGCRGGDPPAPSSTTVPAPQTTVPTTTTTTTLPPPPPAWRASHWGMTKEQVLAAFPGEARRLAPAVPFGPTAPGSTDIGIPSWEGDGAQFRVLFGFEATGLARVQLTAMKPTDATCGDVEKALTDKFAAPTGRNDTGTSLRGEEVVWRRPDHTVTLSCAGVHSLGFRSVTLAYTPPG